MAFCDKTPMIFMINGPVNATCTHILSDFVKSGGGGGVAVIRLVYYVPCGQP